MEFCWLQFANTVCMPEANPDVEDSKIQIDLYLAMFSFLIFFMHAAKVCASSVGKLATSIERFRQIQLWTRYEIEIFDHSSTFWATY